jgi:DnaA family protein
VIDAMTTQLLLDLDPPPRPTFDNFVAGANAEAVAAVRRAIGDPAVAVNDRFVYVWGEPGSGRSHLLRAACEEVGGRYVDAAQANADEIKAVVAAQVPLLAVDDVERLGPTAQEALFHAINALRDTPRGVLVASGPALPRDLALDAARDDLRSRLAWGLVYRLERLDDAEKDAALDRHARQRGFPLAPDVRRYLLTHCARDLGSLMQLVDALDRHARERRHVLTVPIIREFLQRALPSEAA